MKENSERLKFDGSAVPVNHQDLENVGDYLLGGFHRIVMCTHGLGRSFKLASIYSAEGTPSMFLEEGLEGLDKITDSKKKLRVINDIKKIPEREFAINSKEISRFSELIYKIGGCITRVDSGYD